VIAIIAILFCFGCGCITLWILRESTRSVQNALGIIETLLQSEKRYKEEIESWKTTATTMYEAFDNKSTENEILKERLNLDVDS